MFVTVKSGDTEMSPVCVTWFKQQSRNLIKPLRLRSWLNFSQLQKIKRYLTIFWSSHMNSHIFLLSVFQGSCFSCFFKYKRGSFSLGLWWRIFFFLFLRNNHNSSQQQVLLDAPVQLSQISADTGNNFKSYSVYMCVYFCTFTSISTEPSVFCSDSAAKDVQGIWMMKRPQNTVSHKILD